MQPSLTAPNREVLRTANTWIRQGKQVILATVLQTWGSAPRPVGSLAAITTAGEIAGSVSGGCIEDDLITRIRNKQLAIERPETISYGVNSDEARQYGLPCGGRLMLLLEKLGGAIFPGEVLASIETRTPITRRLCCSTGSSTLLPGWRGASRFHWDGETLEQPFFPDWRMLIVGAGQLSHYVAQLALTLEYDVIVCDPREEYLATWNVTGVHLDSRMPDDAVTALASDRHSVIVALTHDPKLDDMALMTALDSDAFYVGALGSHTTNRNRRRRLASLGVSATGIARLRGPVGLPIGSRTPAEIAVAILAEVTAERHGVRLAAMEEEKPLA